MTNSFKAPANCATSQRLGKSSSIAIHAVRYPPHPKNIALDGHLVTLEPLNPQRHANDLFEANAEDAAGSNLAYLPYGPFNTLADYTHWLIEQQAQSDPAFLAIVRKSDNRAVGIASFLRINPPSGSIEVGHINFSPLLKQTLEGTEAMFLMMQWAFENGYRRYEWKCNALNLKSRRTAQRLGFSYEGIFRQAAIVKGHNRDTAWFAAIDSEWPALKTAFTQYLSPENIDNTRRAKQSLSRLTAPILVLTESALTVPTP